MSSNDTSHRTSKRYNIQTIRPRQHIRVPLKLGNITLKEKKSKDLEFSTSKRVCQVCCRANSKYTCPRCNIAYCSVGCFRGHGVTCTETFYRDQVLDNLESGSKTPKTDICNILNRELNQKNENLENNNDGINSYHDLKSISLDRLFSLYAEDRLSVDELTTDEFRLFFEEVTSGKISKYIEPWKAWWSNSTDEYLRLISLSTGAHITNLESSEAVEEDIEIKASRVPVTVMTNEDVEDLPELSQLLGTRKPHESLNFGVVDAILAYAYVTRLFNGDWSGDAIDATSNFLGLSRSLSEGKIWNSLEELLISWRVTLTDNGGIIGTSEQYEYCLDDLKCIIKSKIFMTHALWDALSLVKRGIEVLSTERSRKKTLVGMKRAVKKLYFFVVYISSMSNDLLAYIQRDYDHLLSRMQSEDYLL